MDIIANTTYLTSAYVNARVIGDVLLALTGYFKIGGSIPGGTVLFTLPDIALFGATYIFIKASDYTFRGRIEVHGTNELKLSDTMSAYSGFLYIQEIVPCRLV